MIRPPSATALRRPAARQRAPVATAFAALAVLACAHAGAADALRIAAMRAPASLPLYVARERGFFADERLEVAITDCVGGTRCLGQLGEGKADLATTSEMPVALQAFARPDVAIIATMAHASDNTVRGCYALTVDITERRAAELEIARSEPRMADLTNAIPALVGYFDMDETCLFANDAGYCFNEALPLALSRARRAMSGLALMYLDIDHFKSINDTLGHAAGDEVLKAFASRLQQSVRATDTVARLGGDEFVIILEGVGGAEEPQIVARKIVASVARPLEVEGRTLTLTTSIGVAFRRAILAADAATAETLVGRADAALYAAKKAGRNTWRVMADDVLIEAEGVA